MTRVISILILTPVLTGCIYAPIDFGIGENDEMAETPVTVFATFRNNLCAPRANDSSSRFSAV